MGGLNCYNLKNVSLYTLLEMISCCSAITLVQANSHPDFYPKKNVSKTQCSQPNTGD